MRSPLVAVAVLLFVTANAAAQSKVQGQVLDPDGAPVAGITVRLDGAEFKQPLTVTTDTDGRYVFERVKAGVRVRLSAMQGVRPLAVAYSLISQWTENIDLQQRSTASVPTSVADVLASEGVSASIIGTVRTPEGLAVPGARVRIARTEWATDADATGRYTLPGLKPGVNLELVASAPGFEEGTHSIVVPDGGGVVTDFSLRADRGSRADADLSDAGDPEVGRPGASPVDVPAFGLTDTFRGLQFTPPVMAALESEEDLHVRGGAPGETLVSADGYTLYPFRHAFGALSPFNEATLGGTAFSADPAGLTTGGHLSGELRLGEWQPVPPAPTGFFEMSMLGVGGGMTAPLGQRGSLVFGARHSPPESMYLDALDLFGPQGGISQRERLPYYSGGTLTAAPKTRFYDVNVRAQLALTDKDRLSAGYYDGVDDVNDSRDVAAPFSSTDLAETAAFTLPTDTLVETTDVSTWRARGFGAAWARQWSPSLSTRVSFGRSEYETGRDRSWLLTAASTGLDYSLPSGRGGSSASLENNDLTDTTVRASATVGLGFEHALSVGTDVTSVEATYDLTEEFSTTATGLPSSIHLTPMYRRATSGQLVSIFARDVWRPMARLTVSPGLRVTRFDAAGATYLEPRVDGAYQITPFLRAVGGWSIDHQAVSRIEREDLVHGDTSFWVVADGTDVPVSRAQQASGGLVYEVEGLLLNLHGYYKSYDDLSLFAPRLYPGMMPAPGASFLHAGTGSSRGAEAMVRYNARRNTLTASYAVGRVDYTYPTLESSSFPASFDHLHEFKVVDAIRYGGFVMGGSAVLASGRPYTPADSIGPMWFPTGASVYDIAFGAKNSARFGAYQRVDAFTRREFRLARVRTALGVTVFNVFDSYNVAYRDYEAAADSLATTDVLYMGRAVNVLLHVGF